MAVELGYLLPTRERIMEGRPETAPLLALAEKAEALGYDSVWVGDSVIARPRHDPREGVRSNIPTISRVKGSGLTFQQYRAGPRLNAARSCWNVRPDPFTRHFDGWLPTGPGDPAAWGASWQALLGHTRAAGRDPEQITGAIYVTLAVDEDAVAAEARLMAYLRSYYGPLADRMRAYEACYAGPPGGAAEWLGRFVAAGARHIVARFAGGHDRQIETLARIRADLGW